MGDKNTTALVLTMNDTNLSPLYFGCWRRPGHHFHVAGGGQLRQRYEEVCATLGFAGRVDGGLVPSSRQGEAALHHSDDWTALAWADRTIDARGGSNSVVFLPGRLDFEEAVEQAKVAFPEILNRQPVELYPERPA